MNQAQSWRDWLAFPGPVFRRELGSAARGRWFYLVRALAAGALACHVGLSVPLREGLTEAGDWSPGRVAELATRALRTFESTQFVLVLALVPLLVAGSVAEEKERGTLGLLLAGRLSSLEILADKLSARFLMVLALVLSGLPVLAMIGLLGGVDPGELVMAYGLTLTSAWFVASLSMLVSVHARSASGAVVGAYAAGLAWLFLPVWFVVWLGTTGPSRFVGWLRPVAREVARSSPVSFLWTRDLWGGWAMTPRGQVQMLQQMASLQVLGGLVLLGQAARRLRPVYRAQVGGVRENRLGWLARMAGLRGRSRPPCGDDAMAWKERYAPESAWLARLCLLVGVGVVANSVRFRFFSDPRFMNYVFDEMFTYGLDIGPWGAHGVQRTGLNYVLCENAAILFTASLVAATILAASSIAGERGRGTWSGLLGTPLERREILRAKMWGAIWPVRALLGLMLVFYLASMAATALHPLGFVMVVTAIAIFLWFAVAMGVWVSVRSKNSVQAIGRTVLFLMAVDLAPVAAISPFLGPRSIAISTPVLLMYLPISRMQFRNMSQAIRFEPTVMLPFLIFLGIVLAHAVGAWLLTRAAARRIERDEG
jgi:ABC-type transport system involved in multi-copper enzyme maturation permease subunit